MNCEMKIVSIEVLSEVRERDDRERILYYSMRDYLLKLKERGEK